MLTIKAKPLSGGAIDVLGQLFVAGPTWDGNIISKQGRDELIALGLAFRTVNAFAALTSDGVDVAAQWTFKEKHQHNERWRQKQNGM